MQIILKSFISILGSTLIVLMLIPDSNDMGNGVLLILAPICLILAYICEKYFPHQNINLKLLGALMLVSVLYVAFTCLVFIGAYFYLIYTTTNFSYPVSWVLGTILARYLR